MAGRNWDTYHKNTSVKHAAMYNLYYIKIPSKIFSFDVNIDNDRDMCEHTFYNHNNFNYNSVKVCKHL